MTIQKQRWNNANHVVCLADGIEPYITLEEHKCDVMAIAMAGGDPTDIFPLQDYCLPGEHQRILAWIASFKQIWRFIIHGGVVTPVDKAPFPEGMKQRWLEGYIACEQAFRTMNEVIVSPDLKLVRRWEQHFNIYGID